jgi:MFS family permease
VVAVDRRPNLPDQSHHRRDRAWRAAHFNGALWAFGNGLVSTTLITFLAKDYGATSFQVGLILACPHLAGVLRLVAPTVLRVTPDRRRFSLATFLLSGICLALLPWLSWPKVLPTQEASLMALIGLWAAWHVWMYVGLVAFLSWLGDLGPSGERGRRFGAREAWMTGATIAGTVVAAVFAQWWNAQHAKSEQWIGLAICAAIGAVFVLLSVLPLVAMPHVPRRDTSASSVGEMLTALRDRRFLPLVVFNVWFSFANGLTGAAIGIFPYAVLHLSAPVMLYLATYMRVGQVTTAPLAGWSLDRFSSRLSMAVAQVVVAVSLLFYFVASREQWWWIIGAWTCWIAYVVLNVGLPTLTLKLSPGGNSPAYVAVIMAASGVSFAVASVLGGWLLDYFRKQPLHIEGWPTLDAFATMFLIGFVLRLMSAGWLLLLQEEKVRCP